MARPLPRMVVPVRVFTYDKGKMRPQEAECLAHFEDAAAFWRDQAGIELELVGGQVVVVVDHADQGEVSPGEPTEFVQPLEALHEPGLDCITVAYFTRIIENDARVSAPAEAVGFTFFAFGAHSSYGCSISTLRNPNAAVLAHELGHCFGLCHADDADDNPRALVPFDDDVSGASSGNLMKRDVTDSQLDSLDLSESQVNRARLTITTRTCPYASFHLTRIDEPGELHDVPMTDIPARTVVTLF